MSQKQQSQQQQQQQQNQQLLQSSSSNKVNIYFSLYNLILKNLPFNNKIL
jgi:hypothetical protein